ncbi:helix-turn-helix domain-containing protein [Actinacidiphila sp. ITFR-21]|nr:helix-turn-helix domain-containing protein [Streptomyces sp. ITFR-21]WNI19548.1 helix-turn-helix domain-containing protein [Streptomyces sp. ITFR-21]
MEHARSELSAPGGPDTVAEVAARWQFADTSHFRRAYRAAYGHPPRQPRR